MAPPTSLFSASELPDRIQLNAEGKRRKPVDPGISSSSSSATGRIDLSACELLEMMQWSCTVEGDGPADRPVTCFPVQRYFRRCQDAKGSFMVETTSWQGKTTDPKDTTTRPAT